MNPPVLPVATAGEFRPNQARVIAQERFDDYSPTALYPTRVDPDAFEGFSDGADLEPTALESAA
jgi:hypothetical protein